MATDFPSAFPRITKGSLNFDPICPDDISKLKVIGISYLGSKLNFTLTKETIRIKVTRASRDLQLAPLEVVLLGSGEHFPLPEGTVSPNYNTVVCISDLGCRVHSAGKS